MITNRARQEIIWITLKKFQMLLIPIRGEFPHVQIFMKDGRNPLTWGVHLLSYWYIRNPALLKYYLVNLINNIRRDECFGS